MEEVQSWWEVPAVAHFCYIFRAPFNLFFFEIAELESALLNIQDPDMSISLEHLVTCLLQGCYDAESVNEDNWEEKLHELFNDNFEDDENPLGESYFLQLSPRSKIEVLLKLCELRLDVDGALDEIKNIPSEEMQAKCIGKDSQNNTYWYFTNERLYRESNSSEKKVVQPVKNKSLKNDLHKNSRQSARETRNKKNPNIDAPWSIVCFTINDWEQLSNSLSKSKKSPDKELSAAIKEHLPLLQERVAEKDRLLRKRFLELAPKRTSSRISKVQEMKKLEELKAAEEERKAQLKAEKERAKKEALLLKRMKESRQRRAEERRRAIEERAERAKLRELMRDDSDSSEEEEDVRNYPKKVSSVKSRKARDDSDSSEEEEDVRNYPKKVSSVKSRKARDDSDSSEEDEDVRNYPKKVSSVKSRKARDSRGVKRKGKKESDHNNESDEECPKSSYSRTRKVAEISRSISPADNRLSIRTYSNNTKQSENSALRGKKALKDNPTKYLTNSCEASLDISLKNKVSPKSSCVSQNTQKIDCNDEFKNKKSRNNNSSNNIIKLDSSNSNCGKTADLSPKQNFPIPPSNSYIRYSQVNKSTTPPKISIYKPKVLSNTSDMSKWNSAFDSKGQKVHILYKSSDNLAPKRIKLEQVNFRAVPPSMKSSLTKENHLYKPVQFITYGKIIPSPTLVKLGYKKPPNPPVSS